VRDSRRLEPPQQAQPEERGTGATRQLTTGNAGRCGNRGNPTNHQPTGRGRRNFGATRRFNLDKSRKMQSTGRLGDSSRVGTWKATIRGDPEKRLQSRQKMRNSVRTEDHITGKSRKTFRRGNSKECWEAVLVQRMYGATRVSKASIAEGCESRGNSTIHCRHGLKM